jgi:hypothetical protein
MRLWNARAKPSETPTCRQPVSRLWGLATSARLISRSTISWPTGIRRFPGRLVRTSPRRPPHALPLIDIATSMVKIARYVGGEEMGPGCAPGLLDVASGPRPATEL